MTDTQYVFDSSVGCYVNPNKTFEEWINDEFVDERFDGYCVKDNSSIIKPKYDKSYDSWNHINPTSATIDLDSVCYQLNNDPIMPEFNKIKVEDLTSGIYYNTLMGANTSFDNINSDNNSSTGGNNSSTGSDSSTGTENPPVDPTPDTDKEIDEFGIDKVEVTSDKIYVNVCDDVTVYYTLDGSEPTDKSLVYSEPIDVPKSSETITFKAIATRNNQTSKVVTVEIEPNIIEEKIILDFDIPTSFNPNYPTLSTGSKSIDGITTTVDNVSFVVDKNDGSTNPVFIHCTTKDHKYKPHTYEIRLYSKNSLTFNCPDEYYIKQVSLIGYTLDSLTYNNKAIVPVESDDPTTNDTLSYNWISSSEQLKTVTFTVTKRVDIRYMEVILENI